MRFVVGPAETILPGQMRLVFPAGFSEGIGIFNVRGEFFALRNVCPHMGAPVCRGYVAGTSEPLLRGDGAPEPNWVRDGEILTCPWHRWEFEIKSGRTIFPSGKRLRHFPVTVESRLAEARLRRGVETYPVLVDEATLILDLPG